MSSENPEIVDGHGVAKAHPPGPALRRLADALRLVTDQIVRTDADPAVVEEAAAAVERAAALLAPDTAPWSPSIPALVHVATDPHVYFPFSPMIGYWNPLAPPLTFEVRDGVVHGHGTLGAAYEGPPGCVHGGVIAGLFDELLGVANIAAGHGAPTGTLTIRYSSPTPLHEELRFEARNVRVEGRKVFTEGRMFFGDRLCAEAHGTFIKIDHSRFRTLGREPGA